MNTPPSRPITRHSSRKPPKLPREMPELGIFVPGIKDPELIALVGQIATKWPHVEEQMATMLKWLLGGHRDMPAREIFRSIVSQEARIKMMRVLLESTRINNEQPDFFDRAINAFQSLNSNRNEYVHGLWYHDDKNTYLAKAAPGEHPFEDKVRVVRSSELIQVMSRMDKLVGALIAFQFYNDAPSHPSQELRDHLRRQIEGEL